MNDRVAIIIVNYNGWKDTIDCLKSLEKMNYKKIEVFLVDNASTDESIYQLEGFLRKSKLKCNLIIEKSNLGFAGGNNVGLRLALQQGFLYYLMLNNDTIVEPNFLSELIKPFSDYNTGATVPKIYYESNRKLIWYAGGKLNRMILKPSHDRYRIVEEAHISEMRNVSFATGCCILISRNCLNTIGLWDEDFFLYEEDVDLSLRILKAGFSIIYNSDAIVYHKVSASTGKLSGYAELYQIRNRLYLIKKHISGIVRIIAYLCTIITASYRIIKGEYTIKPMMAGIAAFIQGEKGKHE